MDSDIRESRSSDCVFRDVLFQWHYLYNGQNLFLVGLENTGCGSGGLFPTVLEDIWEGESERTEEGVFENPFDEA